MKPIQILAVVLLLLLVITPALAADTAVAINTGTTTKDNTAIVMDKGSVTFTATDTKLAATTTTLIDGKLFVPETTSEKSTSLAWETTDAKMEYSYTGKTLKETITLKEDKRLSFPITLAKDSKLIPWDNGQWKIVSSVTGNTMEGVILEKPYGIDADNNRIEMEYTYKDGILNLEYNRTITTYTEKIILDSTNATGGQITHVERTPVYSDIRYPLMIDPTWVVVGDREECTDCVPGYTVIRWKTTGTTTWTPPDGVTNVEYLIVGGGGSGGGWAGGGGGAGGYKTGTTLTVSSANIETIVVGAGGANTADNYVVGNDGSLSSLASASHTTVTGTGGGGGGGYNIGNPNGRNGGSGGGGAIKAGSGGTGVDGTNVGAGFLTGHNGGTGLNSDGVGWACAGGGGSTGVGANGASYDGGDGGAGTSNSINGTAAFYAGGGGGTVVSGSFGVGGSSIGGSGAIGGTPGTPPTAGLANTGSGGGGGCEGVGVGKSGGSGIVIIKYAAPLVANTMVVTPFQSSIYATNVNFTMQILNSSAQNWTFGDTYTSTRKDNVTHFYSVAGNYTIENSVSMSTIMVNTTGTFNLTSDVDTNVKSWLHMNGANGGTLFPGEIGSAWVPNSVTTVTATKKFGTASALFNANGDRLSTPSSAVFDFGTGNFTIEQWVYPTSSANNEFIISRTTSGATKADGWGLYHSTASAASDGWVFWAGTAAAGSTGTFTIPLDTWNHVVVQRISGTVNVSVNGIQVAQKTGLSGNYDTANTIAYGDPVAGAGTNSAKMYLDEARISSAARWNSGGTDYSPPYAEYRGNLLSLYTDLNPNSTARFKTDEPNPAIIGNLTPRNRTVQIQYFQNATNISVTVAYNPQHVFASYVYANKTMFPDINVTYVSYDTALGQVRANVTRPSGFYTGGFTDSRASIFDIRMVYWNYTPVDEVDILNYQYFVNGYQRNGTTGYEFPIHNFITTNVTFRDWETFSNFTIKDTVVGNQTILLPSENNFTANRWTWDFGDGTPIITGNNSYPEPHSYTTSGIYNISSTAYLWQNTSVTNTTYLTVNITRPLNYVNVDFVCTPTAGLPGLFVNCNDLTMFGNATTTGRIYNWSFGDGTYSSNALTSQHVYPYLGEYSVRLTVNNTENATLGNGQNTKTNYIIISSNQNQQNTWWTPHTVQLTVMDTYGARLYDVNCNASYNESSMPTQWITDLYGIQAGPQSDMINKTLYMEGTTGDDGTVTFTMLGSLKYDIYLTSAAYGLNNYHISAFPSDSMLNVYVLTNIQAPPTQLNNTYQQIGNRTRVYFTEPNVSYGSMCIDYEDPTGLTSSVTEVWKFAAPNQSTIQTLTFAPGISFSTNCVTLLNVRGIQTVWSYNASRVF